MFVEIVSIAILIVAPWPLVRLLSIAPFRRWYTCIAVRVAALFIAYVAVIALLWVFAPAVLPIAAAAAAVILVAERLRAAQNYGRRRGLPPGRLAIVPRGPWVDEAFFRKEAKRYGPIFKTSQFLKPMCCVIGPRLGFVLLKEHGDRLQPPPVRFNSFIPRGFIRYMEPPDHAEYRRILQAALAPGVSKSAGPALRQIVHEGLATIATDSNAAGSVGIDIRSCVEDMLLTSMVRLFLGIDSNSANMTHLHQLYREIDIRKAACGRTSAEFDSATAIAAIVRQRVDEEFARSDGDVSSVLSALLAVNPDMCSDETLILNLVYMIQIGRGDLTGLLLWVLKLLVDNDEWLMRLREGQTARNADAANLSQRIVKETLRLEQSEYLYRNAIEDIAFDGVVIPRGWLVRICIRDGHRDPAVFDDPGSFDPDRFLDREYSREEYCPLGMFNHACLGSNVIDRIVPMFINELASHYDLFVRADGPREYGRAHWQPSSRLRLSVVPRHSS